MVLLLFSQSGQITADPVQVLMPERENVHCDWIVDHHHVGVKGMSSFRAVQPPLLVRLLIGRRKKFFFFFFARYSETLFAESSRSCYGQEEEESIWATAPGWPFLCYNV